MNILVQFESVALGSLALQRQAYLDGLEQPQEMLLEMLVTGGRCYQITSREEPIGYLVVHQEDMVVEFSLDCAQWVFGEHILGKAIRELGLQKALVKSFDHLFFSSAIDHQVSVFVRGLLVRDYIPRKLPEHRSIHYTSRKAELKDLSRILQVEQDVFTVPERIEFVVKQGLMRIFEQESTVVGFGIIRPVIQGRPDVDLGIAVDTPYRNKGYAIYMMRDLVLAATEEGMRPIAGCASDNPASRRMGERIGLVSRYRLLEIAFQ